MDFAVKQYDNCRVCGDRNPYRFLTLKSMPMPEGHYRPGEEDGVFLLDLPIYWCADCFSVQTLHDVDLSGYYLDYSYTVSRSTLVQEFMKRFAQETWARFGFRRGDVVLEVGSSDGYQLKCFRDVGARVLGFEPSVPLVAASRANGVGTIQALFAADSIALIPDNLLPVQAMIAQYTFDHIPRPVQFLAAVGEVLDPVRGIVILEVHDFEKIVERREACLFNHEHSTYLTEESIARVFERAGMRLVCSNLVPMDLRRGNSMIAVATPEGSSVPSEPPRTSEVLTSLRTREAYDAFARYVCRAHENLARHVRNLRARGKTVAAYGGASRTINTLTIAGLTSKDILCAYDMNEGLHGLVMPGVNVPVMPPEQAFEDQVDEIIVFNYGYMTEIRDFLGPFAEKGGRVVSMLELLRAD